MIAAWKIAMGGPDWFSWLSFLGSGLTRVGKLRTGKKLEHRVSSSPRWFLPVTSIVLSRESIAFVELRTSIVGYVE